MGKAEQKTKSRREILETLAALGGRVDDASGRATVKLSEAMDYAGGLSSLSGILKRMEGLGWIERDINGKRCKSIRLVGYEPPAPAEVEANGQTGEVEASAEVDVEAPVGVEANGQTGEVEASAEVEVEHVSGWDYSKVAHALLETVLERLHEPTDDQLKERLAEALAQAQTLRRKVADLTEDLRAVTGDRDSLRKEVKRLDANLRTALDDSHRVASDTPRRQLTRFMQETPHAKR